MTFSRDLKRKFIYFSIVPLVLMIVAVLWRTYYYEISRLKDDINTQAKFIESDIKIVFYSIKGFVKDFADNFEQNIAKGKKESNLLEGLILAQNIDALVILNRDGKVVGYKQKKRKSRLFKEFDYSNNSLFKNYKLSKSKSISEVHFSTMSNDISIKYLYSTKKFTYIVDIDLNFLKNFIKIISEKDYMFYIVDKNNIVIISNDKKMNKGSNFLTSEIYQKGIKHFKEQKLIEVECDNGIDKYIFYKRFKEFGWKIVVTTKDDVVDNSITKIAIFLLIVLFVYAIFLLNAINRVVRGVTNPIQNLIKDINSIVKNLNFKKYIDEKHIKYPMYKQLVKNFNTLLKTIINEQNKLQNLNINLEHKVKEEIEKSRQKDKLLQQQSKLAAMGEMIGAIAHQWRQPLNALAIRIQNLEDDYEEGLIDRKFLNGFIKENMNIIKFMSKTIEDFRNFFAPSKEKQEFDVKTAIQKVVDIQKAQLTNHNIALEIKGESFIINGYESEFKQVILNIINNAKDAIIDDKIENGKITVELNSSIKSIKIKDNANGIPKEIKERIFEPYFTTKEEGKGTGIGLYMSKIIIEKNLGGTLELLDSDEGAVFEIRVDRV